jgi:phage/plasmid-associated DNA primase
LQGLDHASPVPLEFLKDIFNAKEGLIRRFIRAFAYAANGMTREEKLWFLIGLGGEPT